VKALSIKLIAGVAIVVVLLIVFSLAQEMNRRLQVQREIVRLESEVSKLEKNLIEMENLNQYFATDDFAELVAREKLNYRAEGEQVVLIQEDQATAQENMEVENEKIQSIPRRWWDAFFTKDEL